MLGQRKEVMKRVLTSILLAAVVLGTGSSLSAQNKKADREALDDRIDQVNRAAKKEGKDVAMQRISTETGVSMDQLQSMNKKFDVGPAGLMVASVLANETKKGPEHFLRQHQEGKSWAALARDNKVPIDRLNSRLDRLENAIGHDETKSERKAEKKRNRD